MEKRERRESNEKIGSYEKKNEKSDNERE